MTERDWFPLQWFNFLWKWRQHVALEASHAPPPLSLSHKLGGWLCARRLTGAGKHSTVAEGFPPFHFRRMDCCSPQVCSSLTTRTLVTNWRIKPWGHMGILQHNQLDTQTMAPTAQHLSNPWEDPSGRTVFGRGGKGGLLPNLHACPQEIPGGVHLAARGSGLGLEPEPVRGDAPRTPDPHAAASLDAPQAAEELGGEIHAAARPLFQAASLGPEVSACVVKKKKKMGQFYQNNPRTEAWGSAWMCLCRFV